MSGRWPMSVKHALLALLERGPRHGYGLKHEFEARLGQAWPLNVGQVYTTLARLERDGLVAPQPEAGGDGGRAGLRGTRARAGRAGRMAVRPGPPRAPGPRRAARQGGGGARGRGRGDHRGDPGPADRDTL